MIPLFQSLRSVLSFYQIATINVSTNKKKYTFIFINNRSYSFSLLKKCFKINLNHYNLCLKIWDITLSLLA
jgi:DNA mismatch repair ATPase MutL